MKNAGRKEKIDISISNIFFVWCPTWLRHQQQLKLLAMGLCCVYTLRPTLLLRGRDCVFLSRARLAEEGERKSSKGFSCADFDWGNIKYHVRFVEFVFANEKNENFKSNFESFNGEVGRRVECRVVKGSNIKWSSVWMRIWRSFKVRGCWYVAWVKKNCINLFSLGWS